MAKSDPDNKSSGSEHTKAGDGRLYRNNVPAKDSTQGRHHADNQDTNRREGGGRHRKD